MGKLFIIPFCFFLHFAFGQAKPKLDKIQASKVLNVSQRSNEDSADIYISRLNCNSAIVTTTYFQVLMLDSNGQRLVYLSDKSVNRKLISHLDDTTKVLAIHIILTRRLEHSKSGLGYEYIYDSEYKKIVRVNYRCNNLTWYYFTGEDNPNCFFRIDKSELYKIKFYWTQKQKSLM